MNMSKRFSVIALSLAVSLALCAQDSAAPSQADVVQALLARIDKLEKRVAELETKSGVVAEPKPVVETPVVETAVVHDLPTHNHEPSPIVPYSTPSLRIAGFGDFNFAATDQHGAKSGFNEGQFILHLSSALSSKVSYFGELSFTARTDAGMGSPPAPGFNVEVERSIIRFDQSDKLKISFGRYHTPINYWNTQYHHGSWLQTSESRPEMIQFGGSFLPVHFIGALAEGALPAAGLNLNYNVGIGNGRGAVISRGGDFGDINNNRAWLVNLFIKPDKLYGLQAGGSAYRDEITLGASNYREWITSGHLVWARESPEIIAEVANVRHEGIGPTGGLSNSIAYYVQAAYRLPWFDRLWKPYYRFEYIHIPKSDTVFRLVPSLNESIVGMRYDISSFAAIKLEYRNIARPGQPTVNGAFAQTAFTF
jgi:hypothetical protein